MTKEEQKLAAQTILFQLGGTRFIAMTGAHSFSYDQDGNGNPYLIFKIPRAKAIKAVKITLNRLDLYDMQFIGQKSSPSFEVFNVATYDNVYYEDLERLFTKETGLHTKLF